MPTISMFYGILVALMYEDNDRHHLPHFPVRYQDFKASIAIEDGRILAGSFPPKQLKLVQAWAKNDYSCQPRLYERQQPSGTHPEGV
jgi:hypothetical protein